MPLTKYDNHIFSWKKERWLEYFKGKGLPDSFPRFNGTLITRLKDAATFFHEHGFDDYSGVELAVVANIDNWGVDETRSKGFLSMAYGELSSHYRKYADIAAELQMPYTHLLRIEVGSNRSNLHLICGYEIRNGRLVKVKDKRIYSSLEISPDDWKEGINLPLPHEYDFEKAKLFGFYWGLGTIVDRRNKRSRELILSGAERLRNILQEEVKPLMEKVHNIRLQTHDQSDTVPARLSKNEPLLGGYCLSKCSLALISFLLTEHNFSRPGKRRAKDHLPNIPWTKDTIDGFVLGLIKVRGRYKSYHDDDLDGIERISINGEGCYDKELSALLTIRQFGHSGEHRTKGDRWTIYLNKDSVLHYRELMH